MKTRETTPGKTYSVHTSSGCTVSDKNGWSKTIDAPDGYFTAHAGEVTIDGDDAADVRELFKLAPQQRLAILGVLGGNGGLPAGYKRVEWLALNNNAYSETNITITADCEICYDGAWVDGAISCYFQPGFDEGCGVYLSMWDNKGGGFHFGWRQNNRFWLDANVLNADNTFSSFNMLGYYKFNNWEASVPDAEFVNSNDKVFCIGRNSDDVGQGRFFKLQITRAGRLIFDVVPALDPTGAPCFFDLVSRKTFYNQGTGDFLYPTETTTYALRRVLPDWGKLTEHGLRRLYHTPANYTGELYDYALENGYKPIIEPEKPEEGYWAPRWTETEDEIVLEWVESEPPMDEFGLPEETSTETE